MRSCACRALEGGVRPVCEAEEQERGQFVRWKGGRQASLGSGGAGGREARLRAGGAGGSSTSSSVGGIVVSIAAFQAVDPGSIPGQRRQTFLQPGSTVPCPLGNSRRQGLLWTVQRFSGSAEALGEAGAQRTLGFSMPGYHTHARLNEAQAL